MIVTAVWIVLGAVLHGGTELTRTPGGEAWWWESSDRSASPACYIAALPSTHPLARLTAR
jgi:hypothetical protein